MIRILALVLALNSYGVEPSQPDLSIFMDAVYVSKQTGVSGLLLLHLIERESGSNYQATRYCKEWEGNHCTVEASCYTDCQKRRNVYRNGLDLGLWQLRHSRTWSWIRSYNKANGTKHGRECAYDRECARSVVVHAIRSLQERARRSKWDCKTPRVDAIAWLRYWNGCGSYRKYRRFVLNNNIDWPVAVLPGQSRKAQEHANRAGLTCGPD